MLLLSQPNCKLLREAPSCSWINCLTDCTKMILVWHKFNWREVTSYFPKRLLRLLQYGRRKWQKSVTVYRQLSSYGHCNDEQMCALPYDYHVSLIFTRSWFHFVMGKEEKGRVSPIQKAGRESWFLPPGSPTLLMYPLFTLFWHMLIWIQI